MIKKDSSFSESMSKKQLLALIKCKDCLQSLKDEFLYEHPERADIFKNIAHISDPDFELVAGYATSVLKDSEHTVMFYDGFYEHSEPYMTINGLRGLYVAWNHDVTWYFTRKRDALAYVGKSHSEFINYWRENADS